MVHQALHIGQRVEQEVRFDLRLQQPQLGLGLFAQTTKPKAVKPSASPTLNTAVHSSCSQYGPARGLSVETQECQEARSSGRVMFMVGKCRNPAAPEIPPGDEPTAQPLDQQRRS